MKLVQSLIPVAALVLSVSAAQAQFVKGNEAVNALPDGTKRVETPPLRDGGAIRSTKLNASRTGN